jgi:hypothetical protein
VAVFISDSGNFWNGITNNRFELCAAGRPKAVTQNRRHSAFQMTRFKIAFEMSRSGWWDTSKGAKSSGRSRAASFLSKVGRAEPSNNVCSDRALCTLLAGCCVRGVRFCLHSTFDQRYKSLGAKFVAEKLISLAPSHNGLRSPFERFAARGAHTVCGGWMRLTVHAFVLPPKEDKQFPAK